MGRFGKLRGPFWWQFGFASSSTLLYGSKAREQTGISYQEFLKIISGGQTGVDRGALDAALALGFSCGGWCPAGRLAEDGTIPKGYPVVELPDAGYAERTARNVTDSDGTLIISNGEPTGGTGETIDRCVELNKPYLVIDCERMQIDEAIELALGFVRHLSSRARAMDLASVRTRPGLRRDPSHPLGMTIVLNVAGPRASQWSEGHETALQIVSTVLRRLSGHERSREYSS
jgi:hypothetical protein